MNAWLWLALLLLPLIVFFFTLRALLKRLKSRLAARVRDACTGEGIAHLTGANFIGVRSRGPGQLRGNGALVLTGGMLRFFMMWPEREFSVPLQSIKSVDTPSKFLGRLALKPLLVVEFEGEAGPDAVGFQVEDAKAWLLALQDGRAEKS